MFLRHFVKPRAKNLFTDSRCILDHLLFLHYLNRCNGSCSGKWVAHICQSTWENGFIKGLCNIAADYNATKWDVTGCNALREGN